MAQIHINDSIHWYISELTSRVVAKSGITSDRFHVGKIIFQSLKDDPDFVSQIDGGTGESETNCSLLKRSIQCAISLKKLGLQRGDVMVIMAPNHLDLAVPFYAAMYLGVILAPVDRTLTIGELEYTFKMYNPAIVLCQSEKKTDIQATLKSLDVKAKIITFDRESNGSCLGDFLKANDEIVDNYKPDDFNAEDSIAIILPTSGTTGPPKGAAITYKTLMITGPNVWARYTKFPTPTRIWMVLAPLQWMTAALHFIMSPYMKYTRLQTSKAVTEDHTRSLIKIFRPTVTLLSSAMATRLLKSGDEGPSDLTCFDTIMIGGSAVHKETIQEVKNASPRTTVINGYGLSELATLVFQGDCPSGSCGKPSRIYQYRLIDLNTQEDIQEPNVSGELWIKGPGMFKEYYSDPEATKQAFAKDGWFKTGDLFYRDEHSNYYFVERIKLLLKYNHFQISPTEIEGVIREHPGVLDVVVTGIPDPDCGDLPVACVIPRPGHNPTGQEIKNLVKEKLTDAKQLRGGVLFVTAFPLTATSKINRRKLNEMVRETIIGKVI